MWVISIILKKIKDVAISTSKIYGTIILRLFYSQLQNYTEDRIRCIYSCLYTLLRYSVI